MEGKHTACGGNLREEVNKRTSLRNNPGAAIDHADDNRVSKKLVDERTKTQNNNPRNNDM